MAVSPKASEVSTLTTSISTIATADSKAMITAITLTNRGSDSSDVTVYIVPDGETAGDGHIVFYSTLESKDNVVIPPLGFIAEDTTVRAKSSASEVNAFVSLVEGF